MIIPDNHQLLLQLLLYISIEFKFNPNVLLMLSKSKTAVWGLGQACHWLKIHLILNPRRGEEVI